MRLVLSVMVLCVATLGHAEFDLENYFEQFVKKHNVPCMSVALSDWNFSQQPTTISVTSFALGSGSDLENGVECKKETVFRVASVSKAIGSGLIGQMVDAGQLVWDADINTYLPVSLFPKKTFNGEKVTITLRQLISHVAGIRHSNNNDLLHDWEFRITNSTQLLSWFAQDPLLFKPGYGYHYSNHGWSLIGAIVESVTGRPYFEVLNEFMHSVGMSTAVCDSKYRLVANRAVQYRVVSKNGVTKTIPAPITDNLRPFPHWPAGGVLASYDDLIHYGGWFLNSYNHNTTAPLYKLSASTAHEMWDYQQPHVPPDHIDVEVNGRVYRNVLSRYVLGWQRMDFPYVEGDTLSNVTYFFHLGQIEAANAILAVIPEHNFVFAAIVNRGGIKDHLLPLPLLALSVKKEKSKKIN